MVVESLLVAGLLLEGLFDEGTVLVGHGSLFSGGVLNEAFLLQLKFHESFLVTLGTLLVLEVGHREFLLKGVLLAEKESVFVSVGLELGLVVVSLALVLALVHGDIVMMLLVLVLVALFRTG